MQIKNVTVKYFHAGEATRRKTDKIHVDNKLLPFISICFCQTGKYLFQIGSDAPIELLPGQAIVIGSNVQHKITHIFDNHNEMRHRWIFLDVQLDNKYNLDQIYSLPGLLPDHISSRLNKLFTEYMSLKHDNSITELFREKIIAFSVLEQIAPFMVQTSTTYDDCFKACIDYINEHYLDKIQIPHLYNLMHCSKSSLFNKFKKYINTTPNHYIEDLRLNHAAVLLLSTGKSVCEGPKECGFNDQLYFSKRFKKRYGKSPLFYIRDALDID